MATYRAGETLIVKGTLTDSASSAFNLADFTTFEVTIQDARGTSLSYSVAGSTISIIPGGAANTYYYVITAAQTATLKGVVSETITTTFLDATYSITVTDTSETTELLTID